VDCRAITSNFESDLSYSSILLNVYYDKEVHERFSVFGGVGDHFSMVESSFQPSSGAIVPFLKSGWRITTIQGGVSSPFPATIKTLALLGNLPWAHSLI
jgi:opacity protein-like surface antigen